MRRRLHPHQIIIQLQIGLEIVLFSKLKHLLADYVNLNFVSTYSDPHISESCLIDIIVVVVVIQIAA